ncbi:transcriptional regulator, XRE family [Methylobacterium sp. 4-46]|uniref:helix-turn-helix domain-containing protein n=1 Tax=unclassified Methylobacterium TaxID=2615210 RepID=UPI000152D8FB|nr:MULTISPECIES: helix-turn-helix transcriptional regulator [Methylobacterium]ACA17420.1 transcriptional regulator, XRE family [Methylobacterium sp. 4-46]WFT83104.1 helix-turn-helix transcriptional regulator [Methylobacterium nodulans]
MAIRPDEIGNRLRAYRIGQGLSAEQVAERLGVSRAAVYRIEGGEVVKVETLERLAALLSTTLASLLGAGVEYYASSISYFERMRQLEEQCDQVVAHFPPMSYLLTSENYSAFLRKTLIEALPSYEAESCRACSEIEQIVSILDERKALRDRRRLSVINFVALPEIERWLKIGVVGRFDLPASEVVRRRRVARAEVEHLLGIIEREPMGIQIGIINEILPNMAFQLFRVSDRTLVGLSPFRLGGDLPNIKTGVAMVTEDKQPVQLYENIANEIWSRAAKGATAASLLRAALERSAI